MGLPRFIGKVEGDGFFIEGEEYHHAKVRRVREGQEIEINDLQGNIYRGKVTQITKKFLKGKILHRIEIEETPIEIELFLGVPNRPSKIDELIEAITELGVKRFIPVITKNTAVKEKDVLKKIPKWEKISLNSIKQCGRLFPVEIKEPVHLKDIETDAEKKILFYEKERKRRLETGIKCKKVAVIVGPEGGFTEEEVKLLEEKGFKPYTLGNYILRMETAVISAICQVNFSCR
ncbi:RsmE family RNA methyltransferase [Persephonella sp.]